MMWPKPDDPEEAVLYHINAILKGMRTPKGHGRYRAMFLHTKYLMALVWYAAIWEDRTTLGIPVMMYPDDKSKG